MMKVAKYQPLAAEAIQFACSLLLTIAILSIAWALFLPRVDLGPEPRFFTRLVQVQGLDPCVPKVRSPVFDLSLDVDQVPEGRILGPCAGGGDATLQVSYHGIVLAWGRVPRFCVDGRIIQQRRRRSPSSVASVVATARGLVVLEELRKMMRAENNAFGSVEFDVDGSLPGLGRLHCKTYLFQGNPNKALPPCSVDRTRGRGEDL